MYHYLPQRLLQILSSANGYLHIQFIERPWAWMLLILACYPTSRLDAQQTQSPPNIILIMVDDMGWSDIGCYGGEVHTPTLDRLAREGMRFTQFYNNAKCTTTRASLTTGLYPRRDNQNGGLLRKNMLTLGEFLKLAGYNTALYGKWHLGRDSTSHPYYRGFDEYYGLLDGCCNFFDPSIQDPPYKGNRIRYFGYNEERISQFPQDYYTTDAFTDFAIEAVEKYSRSESPFFIHICYTAPHYPLHAKPEDIEKYRGKYTEGWEALRQTRYRRQVDMGLIDPDTYPMPGFDSEVYPWSGADTAFEDLRMAVYAAMIDCVDQNLARLMETLEATGEANNTLIMFLSDNGGCAEEPGGRNPSERTPGPANDYVAVGPAWGWVQNTPFRRYKSWMNEGGVNTPFIAWWPGVIPADTITREVGHIIDIMPTFGEITRTSYPKTYGAHTLLPLEGKSLLPILTGDKREGHEYLFWEFYKNRAVRNMDWKLVWDRRIQEWELFNLKQDHTETLNLAWKYPERVEAMSQKWYAWAQRTGLEINNNH